MVCLETTFLIDILRGKSGVIEIQKELDNIESSFTVAAPTIMELWTGADLGKSSEKEKTRINELISSYTILHLDEKSAKEAGEIEADLIRRGEKIETPDIMIAAIAKVNGEKLVTRDGHYAKIPGLKLLKY